MAFTAQSPVTMPAITNGQCEKVPNSSEMIADTTMVATTIHVMPEESLGLLMGAEPSQMEPYMNRNTAWVNVLNTWRQVLGAVTKSGEVRERHAAVHKRAVPLAKHWLQYKGPLKMRDRAKKRKKAARCR